MGHHGSSRKLWENMMAIQDLFFSFQLASSYIEVQEFSCSKITKEKYSISILSAYRVCFSSEKRFLKLNYKSLAGLLLLDLIVESDSLIAVNWMNSPQAIPWRLKRLCSFVKALHGRILFGKFIMCFVKGTP
ncbi:hypothetical protein REPUB_Repub18cG0073100 [Reevesia pubescens]